MDHKVYGTFTDKMLPIPAQEKWKNFNQVKDQRRQGAPAQSSASGKSLSRKAIFLWLSQSPGDHSVTVGRVATYTNTTIRSTTTASVGSTTVVICCRASCMACFRSFLSRDVSFLGFPLSCRIFPRGDWEGVSRGGSGGRVKLHRMGCRTSCRENYDQEPTEGKEKTIVKLKANAKPGKVSAANKTRG